MRHVHHTNAEIKRASVSINAGSADNTLVAAVANKKIVLLSMFLVAAGAVTMRLFSNTTGLSGVMSLPANAIAQQTNEEYGIVETVSGEALKATLGGAVVVAGFITYIEVDA